MMNYELLIARRRLMNLNKTGGFVGTKHLNPRLYVAGGFGT